MPKGIPASGKRAPGAGRKPLGPLALTRRNVWLSDEEAALARSLGKGNLSAGLRRALDLAYWRLD